MGNEIETRDSVMAMIHRLNADDQLQIIEELAILLRKKMQLKKHSIMELEGLGKEIWENIDAQEYVRSEREAWGG